MSGAEQCGSCAGEDRADPDSWDDPDIVDEPWEDPPVIEPEGGRDAR